VNVFRFGPENLLRWRKLRWDAEEARLDRALQEKSALENQQRRLQAEVRAEEDAMMGGGTVTAQEASTLASYRQAAAARGRRLREEVEAAAGRIAAQRRRTLAARQEYEVLERLKGQRQQAWRKAFDQEQEQFAGEMTLARWPRV
jgi:flagellar export protein FliJ